MIVIEIELCSHVTAVRYRRSTGENLEKKTMNRCRICFYDNGLRLTARCRIVVRISFTATPSGSRGCLCELLRNSVKTPLASVLILPWHPSCKHLQNLPSSALRRSKRYRYYITLHYITVFSAGPTTTRTGPAIQVSTIILKN